MISFHSLRTKFEIDENLMQKAYKTMVFETIMQKKIEKIGLFKIFPA